ncbi:hypothetical protein [Serratia oryzae]|nr:hypothetical protein [Serratia oryzae]
MVITLNGHDVPIQRLVLQQHETHQLALNRYLRHVRGVGNR